MPGKDDRTAFLARFTETLGDASVPDRVTAAYELVKAGARSLGESANWEGACDWVTANYEEATTDERRKWVALEGSILLEAANT
ncbi:hypothetical protein GCM10010289_82230 [Streptomyces violascens]|uniref:Uncharacterized protein n=1 Tax=Streptomyces violascens TaxID=67381 RepID=A0ABQ3QQU4_9ACTN|nr:hypothetical protein GCM10010289_82230 [Streptomyces violascens]GHI39649.1 hypothetical protein Sviol_40570 [Streptomyces violascens]